MSVPPATAEPRWIRWLLVIIALGFLAINLALPLAAVFVEAFRKGSAAYLGAIRTPDALSALQLTLTVAAIAVPINIVVGLCASWAIAKFDFRFKAFIVTLIDLPFSVSPVVSGLVWVLVFGLQGWLGDWLRSNEWQVIFAVPGLVLATIFVTFPFVARELIR